MGFMIGGAFGLLSAFFNHTQKSLQLIAKWRLPAPQEHYEIRLIKDNDKTTFEVVDLIQKTKNAYDDSLVFFSPTLECGSDTQKALTCIHFGKNSFDNDQQRYLSEIRKFHPKIIDFEENIKYYFQEKINKPRQCIRLIMSPNFAMSQINHDEKVSEYMWGIALICDGGLGGLTHAKLAIEGVENGKYFLQVADFDGGSCESPAATSVGCKLASRSNCNDQLKQCATSVFTSQIYANTKGRVEINKIKGNLRFSRRSELWKRPKKLLEMLIKRIISEKETPNYTDFRGREIQRYKMNVLGTDSFFAREGEVNCFGWARLQLKRVGIDLPFYPWEYLVAVPMPHALYFSNRGGCSDHSI